MQSNGNFKKIMENYFGINIMTIWNLTWSLIFDFCKATQTRDELNLGPKTITVGRLRLARCVASWSTAHSRFAFEFSPNMVTIGPLLRKSLGSTFKDGGQLKKE